MKDKNQFIRKLKKEDLFYKVMMLIIKPFLPYRYDITETNKEILHTDEPI
jgi:hypothetical protein